MLEFFASVLLWHPELSLVPMLVGVLVPAIIVALLERSGSAAVTGLTVSAVMFFACYIGWTALLAAIEAGSVFDPGSFIVLLGAFGLFAAGVLLGFVTYWRLLPSAEVYEPEMTRRR